MDRVAYFNPDNGSFYAQFTDTLGLCTMKGYISGTPSFSCQTTSANHQTSANILLVRIHFFLPSTYHSEPTGTFSSGTGWEANVTFEFLNSGGSWCGDCNNRLTFEVSARSKASSILVSKQHLVIRGPGPEHRVSVALAAQSTVDSTITIVPSLQYHNPDIVFDPPELEISRMTDSPMLTVYSNANDGAIQTQILFEVSSASVEYDAINVAPVNLTVLATIKASTTDLKILPGTGNQKSATFSLLVPFLNNPEQSQVVVTPTSPPGIDVSPNTIYLDTLRRYADVSVRSTSYSAISGNIYFSVASDDVYFNDAVIKPVKVDVLATFLLDKPKIRLSQKYQNWGSEAIKSVEIGLIPTAVPKSSIVTVTPNSSAYLQVEPPSLSFSPADGVVKRSFTLQADSSPFFEHDLTFIIETSDELFAGSEIAPVPVTILATALLNKTDFALKPGGSEVFTLTPTVPPAKDVTIYFAQPPGVQILPYPIVLLKGSDRPVQALVRAEEIAAAMAKVEIQFSVSSQDSRFDEITLPNLTLSILPTVLLIPQSVRLGRHNVTTVTLQISDSPLKPVKVTVAGVLPAGVSIRPVPIVFLAGETQASFTLSAGSESQPTSAIALVSTSEDLRYEACDIPSLSVTILGSIAREPDVLRIEQNSTMTITLKPSVSPLSQVRIVPKVQLASGADYPPELVVLSAEQLVFSSGLTDMVSLDITFGTGPPLGTLLTFTVTSEDTQYDGIYVEPVRLVQIATMTLSAAAMVLKPVNGDGENSPAILKLTPDVVSSAKVNIHAALPKDVEDKFQIGVLEPDGSGSFGVSIAGLEPVHTVPLLLSITSEDPRFDAIPIKPVMVTVQASLISDQTLVHVSSMDPSEEATIWVRPSIVPSHQVLVRINLPEGASAYPSEIAFDPSTGVAPVSVSVRGGRKPMLPAPIVLSAVSSDSRYNNTSLEVMLLVLAHIQVSKNVLWLSPGGKEVVSLLPNVAPTAVVNFVVNVPGDISTTFYPLTLLPGQLQGINLTISAGLSPAAPAFLELRTTSEDIRFDDLFLQQISITVQAALDVYPRDLSLSTDEEKVLQITPSVSPVEEVIITVSVPDNSSVTVYPKTVVFSPQNRMKPAEFMVKASGVPVETFAVKFEMESEDLRFQNLQPIDVKVTVKGQLVVTKGLSRVVNNVATASVMISPSVPPSFPVAVELQAPAGIRAEPSTVLLTPGTMDAADVIISGPLVLVSAGDIKFVVNSEDSRFDNVVTPKLSIDVKASVKVSPSQARLSPGETVTLELTLSDTPSQPVTILPVVTGAGSSSPVTFDPPFLVFTEENGRNTLTITATAKQEPWETTSIRFSIISDDLRYDRLKIVELPLTVTASIESSDPYIRFSDKSEHVAGTLINSFELRTKYTPKRTVYIVPNVPPALEVKGLQLTPSLIQILPGSFGTIVQISVPSSASPIPQTSIELGVTSDDTRFHGTELPSIDVVIQAKITVHPKRLVVKTNGTSPSTDVVFYFTPSISPMREVVVSISAPGEVTVSPALIRLGSSHGPFNPYRVTVFGGTLPAKSNPIRFSVVSDDSRFDKITVDEVNVTVQASITCSASSIVTTIKDVDSAAAKPILLTLKSNTIPDAPLLIVPVAPAGRSDITFLPAKLTIPASRKVWARIEVVTGNDTMDTAPITFHVTSADSRFDSIAIPDVLLTILAKVRLSVSSLRILPYEESKIDVIFSHSPTSNVTVVVSSSDAAVTLSSGVLVCNSSEKSVQLVVTAGPQPVESTMLRFDFRSQQSSFQGLSSMQVSVTVLASITVSPPEVEVFKASYKDLTHVQESALDNVTLKLSPNVVPSFPVRVTPRRPVFSSFLLSPTEPVDLFPDSGLQPVELQVIGGDRASAPMLLEFEVESEDPRFNGIGISPVNVTVFAYVELSAHWIRLLPDEATSLTAMLSDIPQSDVVFYTSVPSSSLASLSQEIHFRPSNGDSPVSFDLVAGSRPASGFQISLAARSEDKRYEGMTTGFLVTILASIVVNSTSVTVSRDYEGGVTAFISLTPNVPPSSNVEVKLVLPAEIQATPSAVFFSPENGLSPAVVRLKGGSIKNPQTSFVGFVVSSSDDRFDNILIDPVSVITKEFDLRPPGPPIVTSSADPFTSASQIVIFIDYGEACLGLENQDIQTKLTGNITAMVGPLVTKDLQKGMYTITVDQVGYLKQSFPILCRDQHYFHDISFHTDNG